MRDYNLETAFLKRMLSYDQSPRGQQVEKSIVRAERDYVCALKAVCSVGIVAVVSAVLSQAEFFQSVPAIRLRIVCVVGLAAIICLLAFLTVMILCRLRLNSLREDSRRLILGFAEARANQQGDPPLHRWPESPNITRFGRSIHKRSLIAEANRFASS